MHPYTLQEIKENGAQLPLSVLTKEEIKDFHKGLKKPLHKVSRLRTRIFSRKISL
jgi:hypothetical protein